MNLLFLGVALWWSSHLFPIYMVERRAALIDRMGKARYRALFALVSLIAVAMMVVGYRQAEFVNLWFPPAWTVHLNNLLMLLAVFLMGAKDFNSFVRHRIRHPMLTAVKVWAVAHLLVNGDLASVILFGGLLAWAVVAMIGSNRRDGAWGRPPPGDRAGLIRHVAVAAIVFAVIVGIHGPLLGVWPFPQ